MEWTSNLNLVTCALTCLVGILILLLMLKVAKSRFMIGLTGIIVGLSELWAARRRPANEQELVQEYRRSTGRQASAQSRAQQIRAKYDREFLGEETGQPPYAAMPPVEQASAQDSAQDSAQNSAPDYEPDDRHRHRRERLDYDDEMDAFFDDTEL